MRRLVSADQIGENVGIFGGFHVRDHSLTLYGSCPTCSAGA